MAIRFIDTDFNNAFYNMAVDEALMKLSDKPVLRFYGWKPSAVSLGYFQSISDINIDFCKKNNIDIVRRITGGKAVFHDIELTYSFIIDEKEMPKSIIESYKVISKGVLNALHNIGVNASFKDKDIEKRKTAVCLANPSWYEIVVDNKKIAAAAQTRKNGKLLQHGPILIDIDYEKLCSLFKTDNHTKLLDETKKRITSLSEQKKKIDYEILAKELKKGFQEAFKDDFINADLTEEEIKLTNKLINDKYNTRDWNDSR